MSGVEGGGREEGKGAQVRPRRSRAAIETKCGALRPTAIKDTIRKQRVVSVIGTKDYRVLVPFTSFSFLPQFTIYVINNNKKEID